MKFTNIRDLKYVTANNSHIDLFATCEEYGEIPMTLNLTDTEDLHTFLDKKTKYSLKEYCKIQKIQDYLPPKTTIEEYKTSINLKAEELIEAKYPIFKQLNITNLLTPYTELDREEMKTFIDKIRKISNDSINNGTDLEDIIWE